MVDNFEFDNKNNKVRIAGTIKSTGPVKIIYWKGTVTRYLFELNCPLMRRDGSFRDNTLTFSLSPLSGESFCKSFKTGDNVVIYGQIDTHSEKVISHEGTPILLHNEIVKAQKVYPLNELTFNPNIGGLRGIIKSKLDKLYLPTRSINKQLLVEVPITYNHYANIKATVNNPNLFSEYDLHDVGEEVGIRFRLASTNKNRRMGLTVLSFVNPKRFDEGFNLDSEISENNLMR